MKSIKDSLGVANKGLAERMARDEQHKPPTELSAAEMERRLREKAELYERIKRGEVAVNDDENDERGYLVDFVRKGYLEQEEAETDLRGRGDDEGRGSIDAIRERERLHWERAAQQGTTIIVVIHTEKCAEEEAERKKRADISMVEQIREQTLRGRAKAEEMKKRRQRLMEQRLERIKGNLGKGAGNDDGKKSGDEEEEEDESEESSVAEPYDPFDEADEDDHKALPAK